MTFPNEVALYFSRGRPDANSSVNLSSWCQKTVEADKSLRSRGFTGKTIAVFRDPLGTWGNHPACKDSKGKPLPHTMLAGLLLDASEEPSSGWMHVRHLMLLHESCPDVEVVIMTGIHGASIAAAQWLLPYIACPNVTGIAIDAYGGGAWNHEPNHAVADYLQDAKDGLVIYPEPAPRDAQHHGYYGAISKRAVLDIAYDEYVPPEDAVRWITLPNKDEHGKGVEGYLANWHGTVERGVPNLVPTIPGLDAIEFLDALKPDKTCPMFDALGLETVVMNGVRMVHVDALIQATVTTIKPTTWLGGKIVDGMMAVSLVEEELGRASGPSIGGTA